MRIRLLHIFLVFTAASGMAQNCGSDSTYLLNQLTCYPYDLTGDTFSLDGAERFTYTYQFIFDGYKALTSVKEIYSTTSGGWSLNERVEFDYDSLGREIKQLLLRRQSTSWDSVSLKTRQFQAIPQGQQRIFQEDFWLSGTRSPISRVLDTLNLDGKLTSSYGQSWTAGWNNNTRIQYQYDSLGNEIRSEKDQWDMVNLFWKKFILENQSYNSFGFHLQSQSNLWNPDSNRYIPSIRITHTPTPDQLISESLEEKYDNGTWFNSQRFEYQYDNCRNLINTKGYFWVANDSSWAFTREQNTIYNSQGVDVAFTTFSYNPTSPGKITFGSRCVRSFRNVTSIKTNPAEMRTSYLLPNPFSQGSSWTIPLDGNHQVRIRIYDQRGLLIWDQESRSSIALPFGQFSCGIYLLTAWEKDKLVHRQRLWVIP